VIEHSRTSILASLVGWTDNSYESLSPENETKYIYRKEIMINDEYQDRLVIEKSEPTVNGHIFSDISSRTKIVIIMKHGLYHTLMDAFPKIQRISEQFKDALFIIEASNLSHSSNDHNLINIVRHYMNAVGVDYKLINLLDGDILKVNNFHILDVELVDNTTSNLISARNNILKNIPEPLPPHEVVYLSRTMIEVREMGTFLPGLSSDVDQRVRDEEVLINYFKKNNVNIVNPENFLTAEDQIKYFQNVKVLISLTSSGMSNAVFMKPGGFVVELTTSFINRIEDYGPRHGVETLHNLYMPMSYKLGHNYMSIPNPSRDPHDIIKSFKSGNILEYLLAFAGRQ
jgi:hypothetical protein